VKKGLSREFHGTVTYPIDRNDSKVLIRIAEEEKPFWVPVTLQWNLKDLKVGDRVWIKANPGRFYWFVTEVAVEPKLPQETSSSPATGTVPSSGFSLRPEATAQITMIPIEKISGTLEGLERSGEDPEIEELTLSAKTHGILQPIIAMPSPGTESVYVAVAGNRRVKAALKAGLTHVPAIIKPYNVQEAYELSIIENVQRRDTSDYDRGRLLKLMLEKFPERYRNQEALSKTVGKSVSWVSRHISAYEEAEAVKPFLPIGKIEDLPESSLRELRKLPEEQRLNVLKSLDEAPVEGAHEKPLSARRIAEKTGPEPIDTGEVWTCTVCKEKFRLIHYSSGKHKLAPEVGTNADSPSQPA